jgi:hypothetical protein
MVVAKACVAVSPDDFVQQPCLSGGNIMRIASIRAGFRQA